MSLRRFRSALSDFRPTLDTKWAWAVFLAGFVLFRLFDIWKPFGIRALQRYGVVWVLYLTTWPRPRPPASCSTWGYGGWFRG